MDMDGTLLDPHYKLRPATVAALSRFRSCGGSIGLVTGRTYEQVKEYLAALKPNLPLVLYNGGLVVNAEGRKPRAFGALPPALVDRVLEQVQGLEGYLGLVIQTATETMVHQASAELMQILTPAGVSVQDRCPDPTGCGARVLARGQPIIKMMVINRQEHTVRAQELLHGRLASEAHFVVSQKNTVEVLPHGVDKASTLREVLEKQGLAPHEVVFFGDSGNDEKMLGTFPVGIAMANCHQPTCDAALLLAKRNDTDTLARIVNALVLLPGCAGGQGPAER